MACIARNPRCGTSAPSDVVPEPLTQVGAALGVLGAIIGALGALGQIQAVVAALGGAFGGGMIAGLLAVIGIIIIIGLFSLNRCIQGKGLATCIAGCVSNIKESFSDTVEDIFPFASQHNRVDVTVKSFFWDFVEQSGAFVFCTEEAYPRRSEIMRCYYYTERVCNAITGALYGAAVAGGAGLIVAAVAAAAIGCATVILCILALLVAVLIAVAAALIGAFAGGQIAKAASDDSPPAANTGIAISVGDLVTVNGNMQQREFDDNANVLWWENSTAAHGRIADGTPQPFSYCDIDEQLTDGMDACPRAPVVIG